MFQPDKNSGAPLRAVLFDFDGTLGDSYPAITASVNHVRAHHGLPPLSLDEVKPHVGWGPANLLGQTVPAGDVKENVALYMAHHPSVLHSGTHLMPGAAELLHTLQQRGFRLGVCSNKAVAFTRELLAWFGVGACFSAILGPEDVARPKPAPDMLLTALARLGVPAGEALYVGDMVSDIKTGRGAGVTTWVVATGSDLPQTLADARPDRQFRDLTELTPALLARLGVP
jgi:phosphoglycolate phosphatase